MSTAVKKIRIFVGKIHNLFVSKPINAPRGVSGTRTTDSSTTPANTSGPFDVVNAAATYPGQHPDFGGERRKKLTSYILSSGCSSGC